MLERPNKIIVVDDEMVMRNLHEIFGQQTFPGIEIIMFSNAVDSWNALRNGEVKISAGDIVITDCVMLGMSGLELSMNIKSAEIPGEVIMFTGGEGATEAEAKQAGVSIYMKKPDVIELWNLLGSRYEA